MSTKIISENQSGGMTGQTVYIGGNVHSAGRGPATSVEGVSWRKVLGWCVGAVGLIASIFGILEYFGTKLWG